MRGEFAASKRGCISTARLLLLYALILLRVSAITQIFLFLIFLLLLN